MKVALGSDHAGYALKEELRALLEERGHEVVDVGTRSPDSTDYPDYAAQVGRQVAEGAVDRGILVCSTGVGMSIAANKIPGVRAALAFNTDEVRLTRAHNDANVLAFGARYTTVDAGLEMIDVFLETPFEAGRHQRRVDKITALEITAGDAGEGSEG
jgi:ribose 5-phosphate isomerase B